MPAGAQVPDGVIGVDQALVLTELGDLRRFSNSEQVTGRGAQREIEISDLLEQQVGVAYVARVKRDVEALVEEVIRALRHSADLEPDMDLRVTHREGDDRIGHVIAADP